MELQLHPKSAESFNQRAQALVDVIAVRPGTFRTSPPSLQTGPDLHITDIFTEEDVVGEPVIGECDLLGRETGKFFLGDGKQLGLYEDTYRQFSELAEDMQARKELRNFVSIRFLKDELFDWIKDRYRGNADENMTAQVLQQCEAAVRELEVWMPIAKTYIGQELKIGRCTLKPLSSVVMKEWEDNWNTEVEGVDPIELEQIKAQYMTKLRKNLQGLAAATIKVTAEPVRAWELARVRGEETVSILRLYCPMIIQPLATSYCNLIGMENEESFRYLLSDGKELLSAGEGFIDEGAFPWAIDPVWIQLAKQNHIDVLTDVVCNDRRNELQSQALLALDLYSKSSLKKEIPEKLIYILSALESLLLKDSSEAIQQNVGERMAFLSGEGIEKRKEIVESVRKVYALRSGFVHHGREIDDIQTVTEFMQHVFLFFIRVIKNLGDPKLTSKEQLLGIAESMKFR